MAGPDSEFKVYCGYEYNDWNTLFDSIRRDCEVHKTLSCVEALKPQNKAQNRYRDVIPYDHSRIVLNRGLTDYINANSVIVRRGKRKYIVTQGPLASTVPQFWLMVWEQNSETVIMLNKTVENKDIKCHWYWPGLNEQKKFEAVNIAVECISEECFENFVIRKFKLSDMTTNEERDIRQYQYLTWSDFEVPSNPTRFLNFLNRVRREGMQNTEEHPPIIHCSAGIGRSGAFCLIDSALSIVELEGIKNLNYKELVTEMRGYRMGLIQTSEQLRFCFLIIAERFNELQRLHPDNVQEQDVVSISSEIDEETPAPQPTRDEELISPLSTRDEETALLPFIRDEEMTSPLSTCDEVSNYDTPPSPPPRGETSLRRRMSVVTRNWRSILTESDSPSSESDAPSEARSIRDKRPFVIRNTQLFAYNHEIRRRRTVRLADRVSALNRRVRIVDRWHKFKRSVLRPATITCGIILLGLIVAHHL